MRAAQPSVSHARIVNSLSHSLSRTHALTHSLTHCNAMTLLLSSSSSSLLLRCRGRRRSFVPSFLRSFVPSILHSFIPSFLRSCVPAFLRSCVASLLRCFVASLLRCFVASVLRCFVPRSFVPSLLPSLLRSSARSLAVADRRRRPCMFRANRVLTTFRFVGVTQVTQADLDAETGTLCCGFVGGGGYSTNLACV